MRDLVATVVLWLRTSFNAAPGLCLLAITLNVAQWVAVPLQPYGVKLIIDGLAPGADPALVRQGLMLIMVCFAVLLITGTAARPLDLQLADRTERAFHADLADLVAGIPGIEQHERPDIADQLALLRDESRMMGSSVFALLFAIGLIGNTVVVAGLLAGIHPAFLSLLLVAGVQVLASRIDNNLSWKSIKVMQPNARLVHELIRICRTPAHAMEIRNFGLRPVLLDRIREQIRTIDGVQTTARRRGAAVQVAATAVFGLAYLAALAWLLFGGSPVPAGDIALLILLAPTVSSVAGGAGAVMSQFSESLRRFGRYHEVRAYARDHAWEDSTVAAPDRLRTGIELRGVGFCYPGTEVEVLSDLDLSIPAGTSVALVGENGAGKTTLVKLLARMYDPGRGQVIIDAWTWPRSRPSRGGGDCPRRSATTPGSSSAPGR